MRKTHLQCTVAQKEAHWPPFLVLIFYKAIYVDIKNILYKKSLIRLITGTNLLKVALGVCFALKSWKKYLLLSTYLITLGKDVTFPLITKFKTNKYLSYLSVNQIPN